MSGSLKKFKQIEELQAEKRQVGAGPLKMVALSEELAFEKILNDKLSLPSVVLISLKKNEQFGNVL